MSIKSYCYHMYLEIKKSWTMWVAFVWIVLGVAETQMELLKPLIGEKYFGVLTIVVSATLAMARLKGISKDVKAQK